MRLATMICLSTLFGLASLSAAAKADDDVANQQAAARLLATTCTVRMLPARPPEETRTAPAQDSAGQEAPTRPAGVEVVTVSSGVAVGPGLIATFVAPERLDKDLEGSRFRITLADGQQARAALRVVDHYSGLLLLEIADEGAGQIGGGKERPFLEPATELPAIGGLVLTAAAAGIEPAAVSLGVLSGADRSLGASVLPPLLQCDVRTTATSSGAALVDRAGKLLGIVVATPGPDRLSNWTYVVPVWHVERLLAARVADKLAVLERRRPSVGLTMGPGAKESTVEVEHVVPGGPADRAGIEQGDLILEADGRKLRSAYQAVDLILKRQPGEKISLVVAHGDERRTLEVTLGGSEAPHASEARQPASDATQPASVGPQVQVRVVGPNQIEVRNHQRVDVAVGTKNAVADEKPSARSPGDEVEMLKTQLVAFERVIERLQDELRRRDKLRAESDARLDTLQQEVESLRQELKQAAAKQ